MQFITTSTPPQADDDDALLRRCKVELGHAKDLHTKSRVVLRYRRVAELRTGIGRKTDADWKRHAELRIAIDRMAQHLIPLPLAG